MALLLPILVPTFLNLIMFCFFVSSYFALHIVVSFMKNGTRKVNLFGNLQSKYQGIKASDKWPNIIMLATLMTESFRLW